MCDKPKWTPQYVVVIGISYDPIGISYNPIAHNDDPIGISYNPIAHNDDPIGISYRGYTNQPHLYKEVDRYRQGYTDSRQIHTS